MLVLTTFSVVTAVGVLLVSDDARAMTKHSAAKTAVAHSKECLAFMEETAGHIKKGHMGASRY